mgnify:CR=1 FL=1
MKKSLSLFTAAFLAVCSLTACGENKNAGGKEAVLQGSENYEEALKECFNASFSTKGGKIFLSYMYPDIVIDKMKEDGSYDSFVINFNEQQSKRPDLTDGVFEFEKIDESTPINEKQVDAVQDYYLSLCRDYFPEMKKEDFQINEGYEVSYSYTENGSNPQSDAVLVINLGSEGWKVITG